MAHGGGGKCAGVGTLLGNPCNVWPGEPIAYGDAAPTAEKSQTASFCWYKILFPLKLRGTG